MFVLDDRDSGRGREARGVAYALVGREATARLRALPRWRSVSRVEWGILTIAVGGFGPTLVRFVDPPARASVVGHTAWLVVGVGGEVRVGVRSRSLLRIAMVPFAVER